MARRPALPERPSTRERVAVALAVLAGVAVLPGGLNAFTLPKLAVASAAVVVALASGRRGTTRREVWVVLAMAALGVVVAAAVSPHPSLGILGPEPRFPGAASLLPLLGVAIAVGPLVVRCRADLVTALALAAVAVAGLSLLEHWGVHPLPSDTARTGSLLGNASDQGAWAVLALGVLTTCAASRLAWTGVVAAGLAVALSGSRGALLGALAVAGFAAVQHRRAALVALGGVGVALVVPSTYARVSGHSTLAGATVHGRRLLWQETLGLVGDHPLGVGPGGYLDALPAHHDLAWAHSVGPSIPPASPETWPLQLLTAGGPLLLVAALVLGVMAAHAGWRRRNDGLAWGATAGLAGLAVTWLVGTVSPGPATLAALYGGLLLCTSTDVGPRRWLVWPAAAVAAVLVLAAVAEWPAKAALLAVRDGDVVRADHRFAAARVLRRWDSSLDAQALHGFASAVEAGHRDALGACRRWGSRAEATLQVMLDRALCEEAAGRLDAAQLLLDHVAAKDPANALVALRRGVVAAERHDDHVAEEAFRRAMLLAPTSPEPWRDLAQLYRLEGRSREAAEIDRDAPH